MVSVLGVASGRTTEPEGQAKEAWPAPSLRKSLKLRGFMWVEKKGEQLLANDNRNPWRRQVRDK